MAITWKIDPAHSEIMFKVKHLMITNVTGYFREFDLEVVTESEKLEPPKKLEFTAEVDSIDTNNKQRDTHLKSEDFFKAEEHPKLKFVGKEYKVEGDKMKITGDLTIRETTKSVTVDAEFAGVVQDPYGQTKAGFTVEGKINRKEFGLVWDAVTEAGKIVVSDEIRIMCDIQLIKQ